MHSTQRVDHINIPNSKTPPYDTYFQPTHLITIRARMGYLKKNTANAADEASNTIKCKTADRISKNLYL